MLSPLVKYIAATHAAKEATWLFNFLSEFGFEIHKPVKVYSDSQSAIALMKNPVYHERSKHMGMKVQYLRDQVRLKEIKFIFLPTTSQVADALTKAVSREKLEFCRLRMGVCELTHVHSEEKI